MKQMKYFVKKMLCALLVFSVVIQMSATAVMAGDISVLMETVDKTQRNDSFKPTIINDNTVEPTNKCGENVFYSFNSELLFSLIKHVTYNIYHIQLFTVLNFYS